MSSIENVRLEEKEGKLVLIFEGFCSKCGKSEEIYQNAHSQGNLLYTCPCGQKSSLDYSLDIKLGQIKPYNPIARILALAKHLK